MEHLPSKYKRYFANHHSYERMKNGQKIKISLKETSDISTITILSEEKDGFSFVFSGGECIKLILETEKGALSAKLSNEERAQVLDQLDNMLLNP